MREWNTLNTAREWAASRTQFLSYIRTASANGRRAGVIRNTRNLVSAYLAAHAKWRGIKGWTFLDMRRTVCWLERNMLLSVICRIQSQASLTRFTTIARTPGSFI